MSLADNKLVARRYFYEVFNQGNMETLEEICAPDFIFTLPTHEEPFKGVEGYKGLVEMLRGCFPDILFAIEDQFAEGDKVLTRWTARGTHTGIPFPTILGGVPAIGNTFLIEGMTWHRVVDGKLTQVDANEDGIGLIQQLGFQLFPTGETTPPKVTTPEENKAIALRYFNELMSGGKLDVIEEILAPNFAFHIPTLPDPIRGREGMKQFVTGLRIGFPDAKFTPAYLIAEANKVAARYTFTATHTGEFLGIPASGNPVKDLGTDLFHFANGQIESIWVAEDALGLVDQMGALRKPD